MTLLDDFTEESARTSVADHIGTWWLVYCSPRDEQRIVDQLNGLLNIPAFWPRETVIRTEIDRSGHRHRHPFKRSLFPGVLMFCVSGDSQMWAIEENRFINRQNIRPIKNQRRFIKEITALESALAFDPGLKLLDKLQVGKRCRVKAGHVMEGTEGFLIDTDDKRVRFTIQVTTLNQSVAVEIDPVFLEPSDW